MSETKPEFVMIGPRCHYFSRLKPGTQARIRAIEKFVERTVRPEDVPYLVNHDPSPVEVLDVPPSEFSDWGKPKR